MTTDNLSAALANSADTPENAPPVSVCEPIERLVAFLINHPNPFVFNRC